MKKSMKFATALAGAAVVVVGGTAFTASQTVPASKAGYGQEAVTGVEIEKVAYEVTDENTVSKAIFETEVDVLTGYGFQASLYKGEAPGVPQEYSTTCTPVKNEAPTPDLYVITCTMDESTAVADVDFAGLAVWELKTPQA